jgi:hypothetical protein
VHGRQGEPVEEAGLDVACELDVCVDRREQRALHEWNRQRKREERVRRESGQAGSGPQPARVHGEQQHRKDEREDHVRRLARSPDHRSPP